MFHFGGFDLNYPRVVKFGKLGETYTGKEWSEGFNPHMPITSQAEGKTSWEKSLNHKKGCLGEWWKDSPQAPILPSGPCSLSPPERHPSSWLFYCVEPCWSDHYGAYRIDCPKCGSLRRKWAQSLPTQAVCPSDLEPAILLMWATQLSVFKILQLPGKEKYCSFWSNLFLIGSEHFKLSVARRFPGRPCQYFVKHLDLWVSGCWNIMSNFHPNSLKSCT